jgi:hypothetical protein
LAVLMAAVLLAASILSQTALASSEPGRDNYILHCEGCHLDDGRETPGIIPGLINAARFLSVPGGREFLVQVPGVSGSTLDNNDLATLMNWVLHAFSEDWIARGFKPYTAEEIGLYRDTPLADVEMVREHLLDEINGQHP